MRSHALAIDGYTSTVVRRSPRAISVCTKTSAPARPATARAVASVAACGCTCAPAPSRPATSAAMRSASSSPCGAGWSLTSGAVTTTAAAGICPSPCVASCVTASIAPAAHAALGTKKANRKTGRREVLGETKPSRLPVFLFISLHCTSGAVPASSGGCVAVSLGSVPGRNTSSMTSGSSGYGSSPVRLSMLTVTTPGGRGNSTRGRPSVATFMKSTHAGSAVTAPCSAPPSGRPSS